MTKDEALALALEALEEVAARTGARWALEQGYAGHLEAITAIKQARALDKKADNARELGLDYEPSAKVHDFWDGYVPEPQYSVNCVNHDCDKCKAAAQLVPVQEPVACGYDETTGNCTNNPCCYTTPPASWMETVTANLVREGVNKHKARELAEHFYSLAQRPFVGLTDEERDHIWHVIGNSDAHGDVDGLSGRDVMAAIEAKLRSKNENTD